MDAAGVPLGVAVDGANRHDKKLAEATLESIPVHRDLPGPGDPPQHLCLDKGYDYDDIRALVAEFAFTAPRWVVERTHSWMNRFRRLLIRWEKKAENYLGLLHFVCAWVTYRGAGLLG